MSLGLVIFVLPNINKNNVQGTGTGGSTIPYGTWYIRYVRELFNYSMYG